MAEWNSSRGTILPCTTKHGHSSIPIQRITAFFFAAPIHKRCEYTIVASSVALLTSAISVVIAHSDDSTAKDVTRRRPCLSFLSFFLSIFLSNYLFIHPSLYLCLFLSSALCSREFASIFAHLQFTISFVSCIAKTALIGHNAIMGVGSADSIVLRVGCFLKISRASV